MTFSEHVDCLEQYIHLILHVSMLSTGSFNYCFVVLDMRHPVFFSLLQTFLISLKKKTRIKILIYDWISQAINRCSILCLPFQFNNTYTLQRIHTSNIGSYRYMYIQHSKRLGTSIYVTFTPVYSQIPHGCNQWEDKICIWK